MEDDQVLTLRVFARILSDLDASLSDNATRIISGDEEVHVLALLMLWRSMGSLTASQCAALESLYARRFMERPWYHKLPIEVLLDVVHGRGPSDFFYAQLWHGNRSIRNWIEEFAWFLRDELAWYPTARNMAINIEYGQWGGWVVHLWWLIEREPRVRTMLEELTPNKSPEWYGPNLRKFFEEGEDPWRTFVDESEREVMELIYRLAQ